MNKNDFILDLEDNAKDSFTHGIEHFTRVENRTYLKYTVLHLFHATELYLKARLAKAHPALIYQRPEDSIHPNGKTVDFDTLINRLRSVGVHFSEQDIKNLKFLRSIRNSIEHSKVELSTSSIEDYVGRTIKFLETFLSEQLNIVLKNNLATEDFKTLADSLFSYEQRLARANKKMELVIPKEVYEFPVDSCPKCDEDTVPLLDDLKDCARCYFCNIDWFHIRCTRCKIPVISATPFNNENDFLCEVCSDPKLLESLRKMNESQQYHQTTLI